MPFTLAHAAAAIPFRRTPLIPSALVVGCFSPDFEYFLRLAPRGGFGHTPIGVFAFDLPISVVVLWLYHAYAKEPVLDWLPETVRQRRPISSIPPLSDARQIVLILVSIIIGAATHILWDSFTHPSRWPYHHWPFLRRAIQLPIVGPVPCFKILQHLSTVVGLAVLLLWFWHWYRNTNPNPSQRLERPRERERAVLALICFIALGAALVRGVLGVGIPENLHEGAELIAEVGITAVTVFWLEVVAYGMLRAQRRTRNPLETKCS